MQKDRSRHAIYYLFVPNGTLFVYTTVHHDAKNTFEWLFGATAATAAIAVVNIIGISDFSAIINIKHRVERSSCMN